MKICHIITALDFGGAERLLSYLAAEHVGSHEFHIIYLKNQTAMKHLFPSEINFHYVPLGWYCARNIRNLVQEIKPDVVHTHLGHADFIGLWAVRNLPVRKFCTMHNIWYKFNFIDYIIFAIYKSFFATIASDCTVICISEAVEQHTAQILAVDKNHRYLIYNAIPYLYEYDRLNKQNARIQLKLNENQFYILFVGRFEKQKSVHTLIEAVKILKERGLNFNLLLVGTGTLYPNIKALVKTYSLEKFVTFLGHQSQPELFMKAADVLVLPSIFEGLGMVILEAYRAGLPVISTNIEGPKEIVEHGVSGFLFEPSQANLLANYIQKLYENDELRETIAKNALNFFVEKYEISSYAKTLEILYSEKNSLWKNRL